MDTFYNPSLYVCGAAELSGYLPADASLCMPLGGAYHVSGLTNAEPEAKIELLF